MIVSVLVTSPSLDVAVATRVGMSGVLVHLQLCVVYPVCQRHGASVVAAGRQSVVPQLVACVEVAHYQHWAGGGARGGLH